MRQVHQRRLSALQRRRDHLTNRVSEGKENSHDLREQVALAWAIEVLEEADRQGLLEGLDRTK